MRTCQIGMFGFRGDGSDELLQAFVVDVVGCPLGDLVAGEAGGGWSASVRVAGVCVDELGGRRR